MVTTNSKFGRNLQSQYIYENIYCSPSLLFSSFLTRYPFWGIMQTVKTHFRGCRTWHKQCLVVQLLNVYTVKNFRRFYGKITGNQLPIHFPLLFTSARKHFQALQHIHFAIHQIYILYMPRHNFTLTFSYRLLFATGTSFQRKYVSHLVLAPLSIS